jgi:hypothetical protein
MPCQKTWCGPCYTGLELTEFPIMEPADEDGVVTLKAHGKHSFLIVRNWDYLMCAFQYKMGKSQCLLG